jgi:hypothetical protein
MTITLSKTRPADAKPNPYRTRWTEIEGVTFEVASSSLDGLWMVCLDLDLIERTWERHRYTAAGRPDTLAWIESDAYWSAVAFTLAEAREKIAEVIASPEWPAIRDAYTALIAQAKAAR